MRAENIYFSENRMKADIIIHPFGSVPDLMCVNFRVDSYLDSLHTQLTDFTVETTTSRIHQNILISYSSLSALKNFPGSVNVNATIDRFLCRHFGFAFFPAITSDKEHTGRIDKLFFAILRACRGRANRGVPGCDGRFHHN